MASRKGWTPQEDSNLKKIVQSFGNIQQIENFRWNHVSLRLKEEVDMYKTPKQCSDRWKNHLIQGKEKQSEWTYDQHVQLLQLQAKMGNTWKAIAQQMFKKKANGSQQTKKTDCTVKNYFYSTLRKSLRLINNFISGHRNEKLYKNLSLFPEDCIGKIIAQDQNKKINKMRITKDNISQEARCTLSIYQDIKYLLWKISRDSKNRELMEEAIQKISEFNRNCRRLRCKKRKVTSILFDQDLVEKISNTKNSIKNTIQRSLCSQVKEDNLFSIKINGRDYSYQQQKGQCSFSIQNQSFSLPDPFKKMDELKMDCEGGIQRICKCPEIFLSPQQLQIAENLYQENIQPSIFFPQDYFSN